MSKTKIIFAGTPDLAATVLQALLDEPSFDIVAVVSQPDMPSGRKQTIEPTPVKALALQNNLEVLQPQKISQIADRLRLIRNHAEAVVGAKGITDLRNMVGHNIRLGEIECAIGIEQLKKLKGFFAGRQRTAKHLSSGLLQQRNVAGGQKFGSLGSGSIHRQQQGPDSADALKTTELLSKLDIPSLGLGQLRFCGGQRIVLRLPVLGAKRRPLEF